ncbi:MAG TPA: hypothetical protein VE967_04480, partial [Gemmatimonadaceae bacterium]|nr:hypothetical protein [Gemmatimonadaceae bacterium]
PIPYLWDIEARRAFGSSFGARAGASAAALRSQAQPLPAEHVFWDAAAPRWHGGDVYFTGRPARDLAGLYVAHGDAAGTVKRVARRTSTGPFSFVGERIVYAELDFTDPYRLYSSLYDAGDHLSGTKRLSEPDARADGTIVAVDTDAGCARLVLYTAPRRERRAITTANPDEQWSAPRWSHSGTRIAAVRWKRGGIADVVVIDTSGTVIASYAAARAVQSHPSWDASDGAIYFTSDRSGRSAVYRVRVDGDGAPEAMAVDPFGLYDGEISPDGTRIAAFRTTPEGRALVVLPVPASPLTVAVAAVEEPRGDTLRLATGAVRGYSSLRTLYPRYWIPTLGTSARDNVLPGLHTSGADVVGRYALAIDASIDARTHELYGNANLTYRGLGRPILDFSVSQDWSIFDVLTDAKERVGDVTRRNRTAGMSLTWSRPRIRHAFSVAAGADMEFRDFSANPDSLTPRLEPPLPTIMLKYPSLFVSAVWSSASSSQRAIGPEDGITLAITGRRRWRTSDVPGTLAHSVIGSARLYKSAPIGGYARHALAVRVAGGWAEPNITSAFSIGGVSGTSLELLPGLHIGDAQRFFFVRGFPPGAVQGIRAAGATVEYRAPLALLARGVWPFPLFLQRSALAAFADAAGAICPARTTTTGICPPAGVPWTTIASVGAELLVDLTLDYDAPTRFRLGVAAPVRGQARTGAKSVSGYLSLGFPF